MYKIVFNGTATKMIIVKQNKLDIKIKSFGQVIDKILIFEKPDKV